MATATKTLKIDSKSSKTEKMPIPGAIREVQDTGEDLLAQLTGTVPIAKKSDKKKNSSISGYDEAIVETALNKVLADKFKKFSENSKDELKENLIREFGRILWVQKSQPSNPLLKADNADGKPDCELRFSVSDAYKIEGSSSQEVIETLIQLGFNPEKAQLLVEREIDFTPTTTINFNELQNGKNVDGDWVPATDAEKEIAKKVLQAILAIQFNAEEKSLLISRKPRVAAKKGFLERLASYCESEEQVQNALKVIKPIQSIGGVKFGISDSIKEQGRRLIEAAGAVLGVKVNVVEDAPEKVV